MGMRGGRLVVIDGFAGPGRYVDGEEGSPLIMLKALVEHQARDRITAEVVFLFIEEDTDRFAHLQRELAAIEPGPGVQIVVRHGKYDDEVGPLLDDIEARDTGLAPTFAFIDPFGYEGTRLDLTSRILGFEKCEVLVYVPLPFIARFLNARTVPAEALDRLFGDDRWKLAQGRPTQNETERALHDLLVERVGKECSYVRSFEIIGSGPNTGATLFFGTNNLLGLARMKESMWRTDPAHGASFRDSTSNGQITLFQPEPDFKQLERMLRGGFGDRVFTIEQALRYALTDTPFVESHVKRRTLKPAEDAGRLQVVEARQGRRRGTFPDGTTIRFVSDG